MSIALSILTMSLAVTQHSTSQVTYVTRVTRHGNTQEPCHVVTQHSGIPLATAKPIR
jgi:hypothetical protein